MLCERCQEKEATIHLTEIIKDVKSEVHLCENCAREIGLNSKLSNFSLSVPEMLSFLEINELDDANDVMVCKNCGLSYTEFRKRGKLSCPECYEYLIDSLKPVISSYHGERKHIGKNPNNKNYNVQENILIEDADEEYSIEDLQHQLDIAVAEERYEDAAELRDMINSLKAGGDTVRA